MAGDENEPDGGRSGLRTRSKLAPAFVMLALIALLLVPLALGARLIEAQRRISDVLAPAGLALETITLSVAMEAAAVRGLVVAPPAEHERLRADYQRARDAELRAREALAAMGPALSDETRSDVVAALRALSAWQRRHERLLGSGDALASEALSEEQHDRLATALSELGAARKALTAETSRQRAAVVKLTHLQVASAATLALLALLAALATAWLGRRSGLLEEALSRRTESDALAAARADVLSWVSHDLKNPLAAIQMATKNLRRIVEKSPERAPRVIDSIERSSQRMTRLIRDVADAARLDAGRALALDTRALDLRALIERVCDEAAQQAGEHARLRCSLPVELPTVRGDRVRLEQALLSLLSNALRASSGEGTVEVSAAAHEGEVQITVRDDGTELSEGVRARLFLPFREASRDAAGVGLYVVKGVAEAHGGRAWVETAADGTKFCFTIAIGDEPDDGAAPAA